MTVLTGRTSRERSRRGSWRRTRRSSRIPRAWRFSVAGIIGRMPMSMYGLGTVLLISAGTGRYGLAGSVSAAGVDRRRGLRAAARPAGRPARPAPGARPRVRDLRPVGRRARGRRRAPRPRLDAVRSAASPAAPTMPQTGPMARARWSVLLAGSPRLHTAFSVESVADELCFVIGPAAVTLLATQLHPAAGVGARRPVRPGGSLWFASQRSTEPPVADVRVDSPRAAASLGEARPPSRAVPARRARPGRAGARVPVPRRDVRHDRPEHGRVRGALRAQGARRPHPRHLRARQRDGRPLVRVADLARARVAAAGGHAAR